MADWDSISIQYDRIFLESPLYVDTIRMLTSHIEGREGGVFLDIGCGTGNVISAILERYRKVRIFGVDSSAGMVQTCSERFADDERVSVFHGDVLSLPFPDDSFDCATSHLVLHHVKPEERVACGKEISRVLKPGGLLVYADMFCDVSGEIDNPERCRDIINKIVNTALYCLDHGAFQMMLLMLETLPADIKQEGEYLSTVEDWFQALSIAGFSNFSVIEVPPEDLGLRILKARL